MVTSILVLFQSTFWGTCEREALPLDVVEASVWYFSNYHLFDCLLNASPGPSNLLVQQNWWDLTISSWFPFLQWNVSPLLAPVYLTSASTTAPMSIHHFDDTFADAHAISNSSWYWRYALSIENTTVTLMVSSHISVCSPHLMSFLGPSHILNMPRGLWTFLRQSMLLHALQGMLSSSLPWWASWAGLKWRTWSSIQFWHWQIAQRSPHLERIIWCREQACWVGTGRCLKKVKEWVTSETLPSDWKCLLGLSFVEDMLGTEWLFYQCPLCESKIWSI
jgi:hypothetical protein